MPPAHPVSTPNPLPLAPIPFLTIIEADHTHISSLAGRFLNPSTPLSTLTPFLEHLTTRLIRHDVSEDLVMRPAFIRVLGESEGGQMADHDRADHEAFKTRVLAVGGLMARLDGTRRREMEVRGVVYALFADLKKHMDDESGGQLVRFRDVVRRRAEEGAEQGRTEMDVELELGREYMLSLVLLPDVEACRSRGGGKGNGDVDEREKCFPEGFQEYIAADTSRFRDITVRLVEDAAEGRDKGYLARRVNEELSILGLGSKALVTKL